MILPILSGHRNICLSIKWFLACSYVRYQRFAARRLQKIPSTTTDKKTPNAQCHSLPSDVTEIRKVGPYTPHPVLVNGIKLRGTKAHSQALSYTLVFRFQSIPFTSYQRPDGVRKFLNTSSNCKSLKVFSN